MEPEVEQVIAVVMHETDAALDFQGHQVEGVGGDAFIEQARRKLRRGDVELATSRSAARAVVLVPPNGGTR